MVWDMLLIEKMKHKENFTVLERQITDYILEHRDEMYEMTLAELAGKLYVSKATVIRYFKKLGFSSYRELCVELAREQNYYQATLEGEEGILPDGSEPVPQTAQRIQKQTANALAVTSQYMDYTELQEAAKVLNRCERIIIAGFGTDGLTAADNMYIRLSEMGKDVSLLDQRIMYPVTSRNSERNTAAVFAVYRDQERGAAKLAKEFYDRGVPVILLCGPFSGEIERYAYRTVRTHFNDHSEGLSVARTAALHFLAEILIHAVFSLAPGRR
ncbi:MAG: MurR/RpiR family transcriptional regulator [Solobacterium sp.]|nr:MurR/RpiR family transcriptional regulator [Solobacterium sp.]